MDNGYNKLALDNNEDNLVEIIEEMISVNFLKNENLYGDGNASEKIIDDIISK